MRKMYDVRTDTLETVIAQTEVQKKHVALLSALATRSGFHGIAYVASRDSYGANPEKIIDQNGRVIAPNYSSWVDEQFEVHGNSVRSIWETFKDKGYLLTFVQRAIHYFTHDRGDTQDNFVQLAIWEEVEYVERPLFSKKEWAAPRYLSDLRNGGDTDSSDMFDRRNIEGPRYRLHEAVDMTLFNTEAEALFNLHQQKIGSKLLTETDHSTGGTRTISTRDLVPGFDRQRWKGRRLFEDWSQSSPGIAGERLCRFWFIAISDWTDADGVRWMSIIPQWTHTKKIAVLDKTHLLDDYGLYSRLTKIDERIGVPFIWYFYGLHGNLVKTGHMQRILRAVEQGLIVIPEHDYVVLNRWASDEYGF